MEIVSIIAGIAINLGGGDLVAMYKYFAHSVLPVGRIRDIEDLCKEEQRKKYASNHTFLQWGLEYYRVLLRDSLIEKGLAYGKPTDPGGVFGSQDNFRVEHVRFNLAGDRCARVAGYIPFRKWRVERFVKAKFPEYLEADKRVADAIQKHTHLKRSNPSEYERRVDIECHSEFWETFVFSKTDSGAGPVGLSLRGKGYLFYPGRKVEETSLEEVARIVALHKGKD